MPIGIVAALPSETAMFARLRAGGRMTQASGHRLALSGMGADRAAATATELVSEGADALVSWGSAAGLDPALSAGTLTLPARITAANHDQYTTHDGWRRRIASNLASECRLAGDVTLAEAPHVLATIQDKSSLARSTFAAAADMESAAIARVAAAHGVPLLVVRAIADDAHTPLPASARAAVADNGQLTPWKLIRTLITAPGGLHTELRGLKHIATGFRSAQRSLGHARAALLADSTPGNTL